MKNLVILIGIFLSVNVFSQNDMTTYSIQNNKKIVSELNVDSLENVLIDKINSYRVNNGLSKLTSDNFLNDYADKWSSNMMGKNKISHSEIESSGIVAENVYLTKCFGVFPMSEDYVNSVTDRIFNSWVNSEKHKNNMLMDDISKIGISILLSPNGMIDEYSTMVVN